jgi:hypothetical protein
MMILYLTTNTSVGTDPKSNRETTNTSVGTDPKSNRKQQIPVWEQIKI